MIRAALCALALLLSTQVANVAQRPVTNIQQLRNASAADQQKVAAAVDKYVAAFNAKDADGAVANYSADAIRVTPFGIIEGKNSIEAALALALSKGAHDLKMSMSFVKTSGPVLMAAGGFVIRLGEQSAYGHWQITFARNGDELMHIVDAYNFLPGPPQAAR